MAGRTAFTKNHDRKNSYGGNSTGCQGWVGNVQWEEFESNRVENKG